MPEAIITRQKGSIIQFIVLQSVKLNKKILSHWVAYQFMSNTPLLVSDRFGLEWINIYVTWVQNSSEVRM